MKAVYSRWTKPSWNPLKESLNWHSPKASILSWIMSVMKTSEHIKDIDVITDEQWAKILDRLKLPINITTELENIDEKYNWFRALWKIYAYQKQKSQFIHIDRDSRFNLWIPEPFLKADIFAQNPESHDWFLSAYKWEIDHLEENKFKFPKSRWYADYAPCMWVFWWKDIKTIHRYCDEALELVYNNNWNKISNPWSYCIIFEQYMLGCVVERLKKKITYLTEPNIDKDYMERIWYTHIRWDKKNITLEYALDKKVKDLFPLQYSKCQTLLRYT